ncbi:outer membrane protein assembly factor, partial [Thioclava sp. BHET1]
LYHFGQTALAPLAPGHTLPKDFRTGQPALSGAVQGAADAAVKDWRDAGYAKADISGQKIVAHGQTQTLDADVMLAPGPKVRFGTLHLTGKTAVREKRLREIAGFPTGQVFSPAKEEKVAKRLRKTGVFSSVAVTESKTVKPDGSMDVTAALVDEKKRRIGFGGELSTSNGATLTGYWLHRNLFGGAERFRIDTEVDGIGAQDGGLGYKLSARLDRPATFDPDTTAYILGTIQTENLDDYDANNLSLGTGVSHEFNDKLTGTAGVGFEISKVTDVTGGTTYTDFNLPLGLTWDTRDKALDAHKGIYAQLGVQPFVGLNESTGSGAKLTFDLRGYRSVGKRVVLAARLQGGTIVGPSIGETPRDYLFYSGGGGTVRGQPYQSLGVYAISPTLRSGGQSFLGLSGEVRAQVWGDFGLVGFYDAGYVSAGSMFRDTGHWQAGAG